MLGSKNDGNSGLVTCNIQHQYPCLASSVPVPLNMWDNYLLHLEKIDLKRLEMLKYCENIKQFFILLYFT